MADITVTLPDGSSKELPEGSTGADLAAAAHLSVADYLGDVPWSEDEAA